MLQPFAPVLQAPARNLYGSPRRSRCLEEIPAVIEVNKDQTEIVVFPDTPLPSDGDYSLHIKLFNPQGKRMYQFNALVQAPGDLPMSSYRGSWLIDVD